MVSVRVDIDDSGTWVRTEEDGIALIVAHLRPGAPGAPFTIAWVAAPKFEQLSVFCTDAAATLGHTERAITPSPTTHRSKVVISGRIHVFEGPDWLDGGTSADAEFARLEFATEGARGDGDSFIIWARLGPRASDEPPDEDDPTAGIYLPLRSLLALQDTVVSLIAKTHVLRPGIDQIRQATRLVAAYVGEQPEPSMMAA